MKNGILLGMWRRTLPIPRAIWQSQVRGDADLRFMSEAHHVVRDYVVRELPRAGEPLSPDLIAREVKLPLAKVAGLLDDLELHMTFLYRNKEGAVHWAYPVTVDETPHRMSFSTGEQVNAAWAIDAIAVPFVQGHLRGEKLGFVIETECAQCHQPMHIEIDSEMEYRVVEQGAEPLVYVPMVDFDKLDDPSIIDSFWRKSIFFWSEEHAKEYRRSAGGERGIYLTLAQSVYVTRIAQGALFDFPRR